MLAQRAARLLIQRLHILGHVAARQDTQPFDHAEGKAPRQTGQRLVALHRQKRLEQRGNLAVDEMLQAALHLLRHIRPGLVIDKGRHLRLHRVRSGHQLAHGLIAPHQPALFGKVDLGIRRVVEPVRAQMELRRQRLQRGRFQRLGLGPGRAFVLDEPEPLEPTDEFTFDGHLTFVIHIGQKGLLLLEPAQQHGRAPIHKSLRQTVMKSIRHPVFYSATHLAPMAFVPHPAVALRDISPRADIRQSFT